jgi:hypothetical protein
MHDILVSETYYYYYYYYHPVLKTDINGHRDPLR